MLKRYGETDFITGMRAYAALAVILIHAGGAGLEKLGPIGNQVVDLGRTGVYAFFVISGFSIATSYLSSPSYGAYMSRRLIRVVPLYYLWLVLTAATLGIGAWGKEFHAPLDAYNWLMHLSFLSFADYQIASSIIGPEWTIPIEVFWYFLLPIVIRPIMAHRWGVPAALVGSWLLYLATQELAGPGELVYAMHWSPFPYLFAFCLGVSAYKIRRPSGDIPIALTLLALALYVVVWPRVDQYLVVCTLTFLLVCFGSEKSRLCRWLFTNRVALFLGTISYGLYLSHVPVMQWLGLSGRGFFDFAVLVAASAAASTATYLLIEDPLRRLALRRLARPPLVVSGRAG